MKIVHLLTLAVAAGVIAPPAGAHAAIDPANFVRSVDNAWFPLEPGTSFVYRGRSRGDVRNVMAVTRQAKTILGVHCVVVQDNLYVGGKLRERTSDWYAQDAK